MAFNVDETLQAILDALEEVGGSASKITPFALGEMRLLTKQGEQLIKARLDGSFTDEEFQSERANLEEQARIVARAVAEIFLITVQKAFDAIIGVLRDAIRGALAPAGLGFLVS